MTKVTITPAHVDTPLTFKELPFGALYLCRTAPGRVWLKVSPDRCFSLRELSLHTEQPDAGVHPFVGTVTLGGS